MSLDDVIKWKHFPRYWPFVRGIHRVPVNSPHKGQWRGALMFSLICAWIHGWVNNHEAGDLRRHHAHYDVTRINWPSHSWDKAISNFDLENSRPKPGIWCKGKVTYLAPNPIDYNLSASHQSDEQFLRYSYSKIWPWKIQGQCHWWGQRSSHIVDPVCNRSNMNKWTWPQP